MKNSELLNLSERLIQAGEHTKAETLLNQVLLRGHRFPRLYYLLGKLRHEQGLFKEAVNYHTECIQVDSDYSPSLLALSVIYNDIGDYTRGEAYYKKAQMVRTKKDVTKTSGVREREVAQKHHQLGLTYMEEGLWNEAIAEFENAIKRSPDFQDPYIKVAECLHKTGRTEVGIQYLERFILKHDNAVEARVRMGDLLCEKGLFKMGIRQWEQAAQINSKHKAVQEKLNQFPELPVSENLISE